LTNKKNIVVVGASAGGLPALQRLVASLPPKLDAAVFIVLHSSPSAPSHLAAILQRFTDLPVSQPNDGDSIHIGRICVARPDYHLVLDGDTVRLTRGPRENRNRPAIDALFRSAAFSHASRVVAVVLTGALDDGTAGLWSIRDRGGTAIVQDPAEADFPSMPQSAIDNAGADYVAGLDDMGALITNLTGQIASGDGKPVSHEMEVEMQIAKEGRALQAGVMKLGPITPYTCPECHGVLVQLKEGGVPRFRCHTGHAYSIDNLLAEVTEYVEDTLWSAIRTIEESALLLDHIASHIGASGKQSSYAGIFHQKAIDTQNRADLIRAATMAHQTLSIDNITDVKTDSR
jgi:two-component system chemotaxis response regulator CheB